MTSWQPIETAPKDGSDILVAIDGKCRVVHWHDSAYPLHKRGLHFPWVCQSGQNAYLDTVPTHWQPLPEPPTE